MRWLLAAMLVPITVASAQSATREPLYSWGKPAVSLSQYRLDAAGCTAAGYNRDIADTDAAKAFVRGSRALDNATQNAYQAAPNQSSDGPIVYAVLRDQIAHSVQPERQMRAIALLQQQTVDDCLVAHGYRRFHLSSDQRRQLGKMAIGSAERRAYLYHLASDSAIVVGQAQWYVEQPRR